MCLVGYKRGCLEETAVDCHPYPTQGFVKGVLFYRPSSHLDAKGKLMEHVVRSWLTKILDKKGGLSKYCHGFCPVRCTVSAAEKSAPIGLPCEGGHLKASASQG